MDLRGLESARGTPVLLNAHQFCQSQDKWIIMVLSTYQQQRNKNQQPPKEVLQHLQIQLNPNQNLKVISSIISKKIRERPIRGSPCYPCFFLICPCRRPGTTIHNGITTIHHGMTTIHHGMTTIHHEITTSVIKQRFCANVCVKISAINNIR